MSFERPLPLFALSLILLPLGACSDAPASPAPPAVDYAVAAAPTNAAAITPSEWADEQDADTPLWRTTLARCIHYERLGDALPVPCTDVLFLHRLSLEPRQDPSQEVSHAEAS